MKNIIPIFGAFGTGTITLVNAICKRLGYTMLDADDYLWLPTDPRFTLSVTVSPCHLSQWDNVIKIIIVR